MSQFSLEEQIEREFACMKYLTERASIAHRHGEYTDAKGFMKAVNKSLRQIIELQRKLDEQHHLGQLANQLQQKGIQVHQLVYQTQKVERR